MPDSFYSQEQPENWFGIYSQLSDPPALNPRLMTIMHNVSLERGMMYTRPGLRQLNGVSFGSGGTVTGLAVWRATAGDLAIVTCDTAVQSMPINGGDPTSLTTSYPSGFASRSTPTRVCFAQLGSRLFIVDGVNSNIKYNGTALFKMGVTAPSTLSAPSKSAGGLTGSRNYKATLVSSVATGSNETEPTAALSVSYAGQQGSFSNPTVPNSDPQLTRWNLYATTIGGSIYYRVNTTPINTGTPIVDNYDDATISAGTVAPTTLVNSEPIGAFNLLVPHQGRLVGVYASEPNTLYWSDIGLDTAGIYPKPESWPPRNRLVFGENGGTAITALVSFFDWLLIFQNFGTWSIKDDINSDAKIIKPLLVGPDNRGIGVSDITNVAIAENKVIAAAKDGLYQIVRQVGATQADLAVTPLTPNISSLYQSIDFSAGGTVAYDRDHSRFLFWGKGITV